MTVDVASVFLEALVQAVEQERLRVNTRRNGHVFIMAVFSFVTYPVGVGDVARWIRKRRDGPQHDFVRDEIVQALRSEGYLLGVGMGGRGKAMRVCDIRSDTVDELCLRSSGPHVAWEGLSNAVGEAYVGTRRRFPDLTTWQFNWSSPTVSGRLWTVGRTQH